jgi:leucyl-tRNA synthetase
MFGVPFEENVQWSEEGIRGSSKFLHRIWRLVTQYADGFDSADWKSKIGSVSGKERDLRRKTHLTIAKVTSDLENFHFNTAIAAMMELVNVIYDVAKDFPSSKRSAAIDEAIENLIPLLSPFAPHIADELWEGIGKSGFLYQGSWPVVDEAAAKADEITLVVQVNGKLRDKIAAPADSTSEHLQELALASPKVAELLQGRAPKKVIVVPGKLVNIVG